MDKTAKITAGYIALSVVLLAIAAFYIVRLKAQVGAQNQQIMAVTDTLHHYVTADGKNATYIQTLIANRDDLMAISKRKDTVVYKLLLKNKNINDITSVKTQVRIDTVSRIDTEYIVKDGKHVPLDSVYLTKTIDNKYYTAAIRIVNDSVALKIRVTDNITLTHEYKSNGFLRPKSLIVIVINDNPYSFNMGLSSYQIAPPKSSNTIPFLLGAGLATAILLFLHK